MAKASDNVFPKLIVAEGSVPATPSAGQQKLYVDTADHKLKRVNSAGSVTTIEGAGGGGGTTAYPPGSADIPPTSPNAKDDEFDGTTSVTWTATPTAAAAWNINSDRLHHLHLQALLAQAANTVGRHQPVPGSYPFTFTTKLAGHTARSNFSYAGLVLAPASPISSSLLVYFGPQANTSSSGFSVRRGSNNFAGSGSFSETVSPVGGMFQPVYLRITVNSATSIDLSMSLDGVAWLPVQSAFNPGFTPGVMGLVACYNGGGAVDAYFDFFRVT